MPETEDPDNINELKAAGILHDIASPLTTLLISLEDNDVKTASQAAEEIKNLVASYDPPQPNTIRKFSVCSEIQQCIGLVNFRLAKNNISLQISKNRTMLNEPVLLEGDVLKFHQLITNLLVNATEALEIAKKTNKQIKVSCKRNKDSISITIADNGSGIHPDKLQHVFLPFYSTKKGRNSGIGLFVCKQIAEIDFGGDIKVRSRAGKGTVFTVRFPLQYVSQ